MLHVQLFVIETPYFGGMGDCEVGVREGRGESWQHTS